MNLRRAAMQDQGLPMTENSEYEGDTIGRRTEPGTPHEHYVDSQLSQNTTADFLELNDIHD